MHHHLPRSFGRAAAIVATLALALTACGGDDDEVASATTVPTSSTPAPTGTTPADTSPATTEPTGTVPATTAATSDASTTTEATGDENDDTIIVGDIGDMPDECVDLLSDFLKLIEPSVSEIDWESATLGDFEAIADELAGDFESLDQGEVAAGCENYDFASDEESLAAAIEIAEQEAPGTVGWLEFLGQLSLEPSGSASDGPQDCAAAIAYVEGLVGEGKTMSDIPFGELSLVTQAFSVITTDCPSDEATDFFARAEIANFMS